MDYKDFEINIDSEIKILTINTFSLFKTNQSFLKYQKDEKHKDITTVQ